MQSNRRLAAIVISRVAMSGYIAEFLAKELDVNRATQWTWGVTDTARTVDRLSDLYAPHFILGGCIKMPWTIASGSSLS
jgi:hypothetical protein